MNPTNLQPQTIPNIKSYLLSYINDQRKRFSCNLLYDDLYLTQLIENLGSQYPYSLNMKSEDFINALRIEVSPGDLEYLTQEHSLTVRGTHMVNTAENTFREAMDLLYQAHKEKFIDKRFTNIAIVASQSSASVSIKIILIKTMLSVDSIYSEGDYVLINGIFHDSQWGIFCLKFVDTSSRNTEVIIGPLKIQFNKINRAFVVRFHRQFIASLNSAGSQPEVQFYAKHGADFIRYGEGSELSFSDFNKLHSMLKLCYVMPYVYMETNNTLVKGLVQSSSMLSGGGPYDQERLNVKKNGAAVLDFSDAFKGGNRVVQTQNVTKRHMMNSPIPHGNVLIQNKLNNKNKTLNNGRMEREDDSMQIKLFNSPKWSNGSLQNYLPGGNKATSSRQNHWKMGNPVIPEEEEERPFERIEKMFEGSNLGNSFKDKGSGAIKPGPTSSLQQISASTSMRGNHPSNNGNFSAQLINPRRLDTISPMTVEKNVTNHHLKTVKPLNSGSVNLNAQSLNPSINYPVRLNPAENMNHNLNLQPNPQPNLLTPQQQMQQLQQQNLFLQQPTLPIQSNVLYQPTLLQPYYQNQALHPMASGLNPTQMPLQNDENLSPQTNFVPFRTYPANLIYNTSCYDQFYANNSQNIEYKLIHNYVKNDPYQPKDSIIDPNVFKNGIHTKEAKALLLTLERHLVTNAPDKVSQYIELYNSLDMTDVLLRFKNEEIKAHKVVLIQSPYLKEIIQSSKVTLNELIKIIMPDYLRIESFKVTLKYMYHSGLEEGELDAIDLLKAREILLTAFFLKLYHLMKIVLLKVLIPKMDKSLCLELLKDSYHRDEDQEAKVVWKCLHNYCLSYFALNSKSILAKFSSSLQGVDVTLVYKIVQKGLTKCRDLEHMYELLAVLIDRAYAENVIDILASIRRVTDKISRFDTKFIPCKEEILKLNPNYCYETSIISCTDFLNNMQGSSNHTRILEEEVAPLNKSSVQKEANNENASKKKASLYNHLELNLRTKNGGSLPPSSSESADMKTVGPLYSIKIDLDINKKNKTIISEVFSSDSRAWCLYIDIDEEQKVSLFIQERGIARHCRFENPFKLEFTTCKILMQIKDESNEYDTVTFYSFPNDHHSVIGHRKFFHLPYIMNKNHLQVNVWIQEYPVYGCALQYLSSRFGDILREAFAENEVANAKMQQIIRSDETILFNLKAEGGYNDIKNVSRVLASDEKKQKIEFRKRKSINSLEVNLFTQTANLVVELGQQGSNSNANGNNSNENCKDNNAQDVRKADGAQSKEDKGNTDLLASILNHGVKNTNNINNLNSFPRQNLINSINNSCQSAKKQTFYDISPFDFFYLISSDSLTLDHEKFITYFMYRYVIEKNDEMITLLTFAIRFAYVDLAKLFNMARDHTNIRSNSLFKAKLEFEIERRIRNLSPLEKPRRFYSFEMYQNWSFKDDLRKWLLESDHHQGYRLKVDELKKILQEKENQLKINEDKVKNMQLEMKRLHDQMRNYINEDGLKKKKFNEPPVMESNTLQSLNNLSTFANPNPYNLNARGFNFHGSYNNTGLNASIQSLKNNCAIF